MAGVDVRGGAPGTLETDLLGPINLVERVHAVLLTGDSAFGFDAASGVMRYLESHRIGFKTAAVQVPIVPAAVIYDLDIGDNKIRPDPRMGFTACVNASSKQVAEGNIGAGTGASVGKLFGMPLVMKSGLGTSSIKLAGIVVGALVVVNAFGDIIDPANGNFVAGLRSGKIGPLCVGGTQYLANTIGAMRTLPGRTALRVAHHASTVIGVVATNARLSKAEATKVAQMAHDGLSRAIAPAHTMLDGDTIFALSTGRARSDVTTEGTFAAYALTAAILRAVRLASSAGGLPGLNN